MPRSESVSEAHDRLLFLLERFEANPWLNNVLDSRLYQGQARNHDRDRPQTISTKLDDLDVRTLATNDFMSNQTEYTDQQGRKFFYENGTRIYVDGGKDVGAAVAISSDRSLDGFTRHGSEWTKKEPLKTSYGKFDVRLLAGKPDKKMVDLASKATEFTQTHIEEVVDIVFGHYLWAVKNFGQDEIRASGMPKKVERKKILASIPERAILVDKLDTDLYVCCLRFEIPYDPEHGLELELEDGRISTVNKCEFAIKDSCLEFT